MATFSSNEFRGGLKFMLNNEPYSVVEAEFVKPGKGQAFTRTKIRNLKSGRVIDKTFRSTESVEAADVIDVDMQYLYTDGDFWYFMHPETFDQVGANATAIADAKPYLKEQDMCMVTLWDGEPLAVQAPNHVELTITDCEPGIRGDTAQGATKPATVETGATVRVPLFVEEGEVIRIDTRTGEYMARVKQ